MFFVFWVERLDFEFYVISEMVKFLISFFCEFFYFNREEMKVEGVVYV